MYNTAKKGEKNIFMRYENCIFDYRKSCDDCGKCDYCDLNPKVLCNNCGKCLEMEGIDTKAIQIASVIDTKEESEMLSIINQTDIDSELRSDDEYLSDEEIQLIDDDYTSDDYIDDDRLNEEEISLEYIDDIDGLKELLEEHGDLSKLAVEEYPGFFRISTNKK